MLVSLEALAMSGTSSFEYNVDIEEWERNDLEQTPPPHLLFGEEEEESIGEGNVTRNSAFGISTNFFLPNRHAKKDEDCLNSTAHLETLDRTMDKRIKRENVTVRAFVTLCMIVSRISRSALGPRGQ
ncbi:hypothetical protein L6164_025165 [Bauhinia variegata]|uniref:Uncharacterized protein n=1 Tax=Bauhinia variegata TaxID=167791 RepID=A0ACB9M157_BAUVA|nr:hypothetical protein L6164_025165 [Bauhinia variegata]